MRSGSRRGFTLIEVMGALVIFSVGVLMAVGLSDAMGERLSRAAIRSELIARARTRMDSLQVAGFDGLVTGSSEDAITVRGRAYRETIRVSPFSPLVLEVFVAMEPSGTVRGPRHSVTSYVAGRW